MDKFNDFLSLKKYRLLALLALGTLLFGTWGFNIYEIQNEPNHSLDNMSVFYHACQLLIGHGVYLNPPIPWQLHVGRILGIFFLFTTGFAIFLIFFRNEMLLIRHKIHFGRKQIVICGLGDLGLRLALSAKKHGRFVVAIEKKGEINSLEQAKNNGILVIEGDATDPETLKKSKISRCDFVVASCKEDKINISIAASIGNLLKNRPNRKKPLICRLMIQDDRLSDLIQNEELFFKYNLISPNYHVNLKDLHVHYLAARQCFKNFHLDFQPIHHDSPLTIHLVVAGFDMMGENIALQAMRIGHFANNIQGGHKIKITILDKEADSKARDFKKRCFDKADKICHLSIINGETLNDFTILENELTTFVICFEKDNLSDDRRNFEFSIDLAKKLENQKAQILLYQKTISGYASLYPTEHKQLENNGYPLMGAFGMIENIYTWDILHHESEDLMARSIHENYLDTIRVSDKSKPPIGTEWKDLNDGMKESNRQSADHLPVKLRAININFNPYKPETYKKFKINKRDIKILAQMEHNRWCAERWLAGWEYVKVGPDKVRKLSIALTDWDSLTEEDKTKDRNQVKAIPDILIKYKKQIQLLHSRRIFVPFIQLKYFIIDQYKRLRFLQFN